MPKTAKNLFSTFVSYDYLLAAHERVGQSKREGIDRYNFEINLDENIINLQNQLIWHTYKPLPVRMKIINDPKRRVIHVPAYVDRVAQGSFNLTVRPYLEKKLIPNTYACRECKGLQVGCENIQRSLPDWCYVIYVDFKSYFDSIPHHIAYYLWSRVISDKDMLWFLKTTLESFDFDNSGRLYPCGIHKGNVMSQDTGNLVLSALDHYLVDQLGLGGNVHRFMDDMVVGASSHQEAMDILYELDSFATNRLGLTLSPKKTGIQRYDDKRGVHFCKRIIHRDYIEMDPIRLCQTMRKVRMFAREGRIDDIVNARISFEGEMKHLAWTPLAKKTMDLMNELCHAF